MHTEFFFTVFQNQNTLLKIVKKEALFKAYIEYLFSGYNHIIFLKKNKFKIKHLEDVTVNIYNNGLISVEF